MYDRACPSCSATYIDRYEPVTDYWHRCEYCGRLTERVWLGHAAAVHQDSIEGGVLIEHGLVNPDGSPRRYYSKSEIRRECVRRGLTQRVEHVPVPQHGGDKSPHTSRWV
jgi:hypothetical protein